MTCITSSRLEPVYFRKGAEEGDRHTWTKYGSVIKREMIADQRRMRRNRIR